MNQYTVQVYEKNSKVGEVTYIGRKAELIGSLAGEVPSIGANGLDVGCRVVILDESGNEVKTIAGPKAQERAKSTSTSTGTSAPKATTRQAIRNLVRAGR